MLPPPHPSARAMTIVIRVGTALSTALLALGVVVALVALESGAGDLLLKAGLIILMITPVANLIVALVDEISVREWGFVVAGLVVLLLLGGSVLVALS
jgi:uncharacterized membrane protein